MVVSEEVPGLFKTQLGQAVLILVLMDGGIGVTLTHFEGKNAES